METVGVDGWQVSSVGVVTALQSSPSRIWFLPGLRNFSVRQCWHRLLGPPVQWLPGFFLWGKAARARMRLQPSYGAEVTSGCSCTTTSPYAQGQLHLCVMCFVYFTRVHCVGFWDLESCLVLVWIRGKWLCRLVGCGVAVGETCCVWEEEGQGYTACLSSAWRMEAEWDSGRGRWCWPFGGGGTSCFGTRNGEWLETSCNKYELTSGGVQNCCPCFVP
jgi:hypothetical protein